MGIKIKARETLYNGRLFRSTLEARWAVFFDSLGIEWQYEPKTYEFDGLKYLPDFWLPAYGSFVEIKPISNNFDGFEKCSAFAKYKPLVVLCGKPSPNLSAWVRLSSKLVSVKCEFGLCDQCNVPLLAGISSITRERCSWVAILGPASKASRSNRCHHQFVHSPLYVRESDSEDIARAKLVLSTAYNKANSARYLWYPDTIQSALLVVFSRLARMN